MKKLFASASLIVLLVGCASSHREVRTADGVIYEPAGARLPNPDWDVNARNLDQNPYRAPYGYGWSDYRSTIDDASKVDIENFEDFRLDNEQDIPFR